MTTNRHGTSRPRSRLMESLEPRRLMAATLPTFTQTNLVSDGSTQAATTDPNLVNPWGLAINATNGNIWVSDNGTGVSTIYSPAGTPNPLVVTIPGPGGGASAPTGTVSHRGSGFDVTANGASTPSQFIFATEDGTLAGWNPSDGSTAVMAVDDSASGAVFKGIAIAGSGKGARLFLTDFHNDKVDVFDTQFNDVTAAGTFADPNLSAGFAPFGIQNVHNKIFVTYAKQDAAAHDDVAGPGKGFVDEFTTKGKLIRRFASNGNLNSPWAVTQGIGSLSNDILVGNFGNGVINIFDARGNDLGTLNDSTGNPITLDGLWALLPGQKQQKQSIYFSAGPNSESNGLYGMLTVNPKAKGSGRSPWASPNPPATTPSPYAAALMMGM